MPQITKTKILSNTDFNLLETDINNFLLANNIFSPKLVDIKYSTGGASGGGDILGVAETNVSFAQTGANYFARYTPVNVLIGSPADFSITPGGPGVSDQLFCNKICYQVQTDLQFTATSPQPATQRIATILFAGARLIGGSQSVTTGPANMQVQNSLNVGYVGASQPISIITNWNGAGILTSAGSKLSILYQQSTGAVVPTGITFSAMIIYQE